MSEVPQLNPHRTHINRMLEEKQWLVDGEVYLIVFDATEYYAIWHADTECFHSFYVSETTTPVEAVEDLDAILGRAEDVHRSRLAKQLLHALEQLPEFGTHHVKAEGPRLADCTHSLISRQAVEAEINLQTLIERDDTIR